MLGAGLFDAAMSPGGLFDPAMSGAGLYDDSFAGVPSGAPPAPLPKAAIHIVGARQHRRAPRTKRERNRAAGAMSTSGNALFLRSAGVQPVPTSRLTSPISIVKHGRRVAITRRPPHVLFIATTLVPTTIITGSGASLGTSVAYAQGIAIITGSGASQTVSTAAAASIAIATGTGRSLSITVAPAAGSSIVVGNGQSQSVSVATATGSSVALGNGSSLSVSLAASSSQAPLAVGVSLAISMAYATGFAIAAGDGASTSVSTAIAPTAAIASGSGAALSVARTSGEGSALAVGNGASLSISYATASQRIIKPIVGRTVGLATSVETFATQLDSNGVPMQTKFVRFTQYETGPITIQITDADGSVVDLSDLTNAELIVRARHGTTLVVDHVAIPQPTGQGFVWNRQEDEVAVAGEYILQLQGQQDGKTVELPTSGLRVHIEAAVAALA